MDIKNDIQVKEAKHEKVHNVWFHLYEALPKTNIVYVDWMEIGAFTWDRIFRLTDYILIVTEVTGQYKFVKFIEMYPNYTQNWFKTSAQQTM